MDSLTPNNTLLIHSIPVIAIAGYLKYPIQIRINSKALYIISIIHNTILITFSAWTFFSLMYILYTDGIVFESNYYFQNLYFDKIIFYFYLSKYYEFLDTFLLYLNGKTPIFLQKYHHVGAVLTWHLLYVYKVDAVWTGTLINSFIHTIMYSYYLGCLLKINQVRFIKQYITSMQLSQLFVLFANAYLYRPPIEIRRNYYIGLFTACYASGLIILFLSFYYKNYVMKIKV